MKQVKAKVKIQVHGPEPKRVSFALVKDPLISPVPKGTILGTVAVDPQTWKGAIAVSGDDSNKIGVDAQHRLVTLEELIDAREYEVVITAAP